MVRLNPYFFERCAWQQAVTLATEGPYNVQTLLGDYSQEALCPGAGLTGELEHFLAQRIQSELERQGKDPTVAIDSGGGLGITWLRLARRFQQEIRDERLLLAVTSLEGNPLHFLNTAYMAADEYAIGYSKMRQQEVHEADRLFNLYGDDVCYLAANRRLRDSGMLQGFPQAALVHERLSGTVWSKVPETYVLRMGSLVAERGIYMASRSNLGQVFGTMHDHAGRERGARLVGVWAAHQALTTVAYGLTMTESVQAGPNAGLPLNYRVFCGPRAEPITV